MGPNGAYIKTFYTNGWENNNILKAISWLKENLTESTMVEDLAKKVNMASSTFYRKFKNITSLSPIQFQKRLRLQKARQLMLINNLNASTALLEVGYDNFGQFSREYKRLFGEPPHRDIMKIRNTE
jgi:transcriptional regulator GlxA family with amidase domain